MDKISTRDGDEFEPRSRLVSKPGGQQGLAAAARTADDDTWVVEGFSFTLTGNMPLITIAVCAPEQGRILNRLFKALLSNDDDCDCDCDCGSGNDDSECDRSAVFFCEGMQPIVHERSCFLISSRPSTTGTGWEPATSSSGQVSNSAEVGCRSQ